MINLMEGKVKIPFHRYANHLVVLDSVSRQERHDQTWHFDFWWIPVGLFKYYNNVTLCEWIPVSILDDWRMETSQKILCGLLICSFIGRRETLIWRNNGHSKEKLLISRKDSFSEWDARVECLFSNIVVIRFNFSFLTVWFEWRETRRKQKDGLLSIITASVWIWKDQTPHTRAAYNNFDSTVDEEKDANWRFTVRFSLCQQKRKICQINERFCFV